jgi:ABC-type multidrug transport system permease subunit
MRFIWITALKDLTRLRRDPFSFTAWLGIPVVFAVLMSLVFGRGGAVPQGRLLVADEDDSVLSTLLTGAFGRGPLSKMLLVEKASREEGRKRIDRGEVSALLIVPKGLQSAYLRSERARLELFTNPSQRILPKIVEESLSIMLEGGFYMQKLAGEQLRAFDTGRAPSDETVIAMNRLGTMLHKYIDPPLIDLEMNMVQEQKQTQSFTALFFPGMFFMTLVFVARTLADEIWKERMFGTLRRLAGTAAPLGGFLAGRLVSVALVFFALAFVAILALSWVADAPLVNLPAAGLWLVFSGTVFFLLLLVATLHASSLRAANVLGNLVVFPLVIVGGGFFPFEVMPDSMARIGRLTPNGWALVQFKAILSGSVDATALAMTAAGMLLVSVLAFLLALRRIRRNFLV